MLFLFLAAAAWLGYYIFRAHQTHEAVSAIEKLGGWVVYNYDGVRRTQPAGPLWLRKILGDKYFVKVDAIHVGGANIHVPELEQVVAQVQRLPDADTVYLENLKLGDPGIEHILKLKHLKRLFVADNWLTGPGGERIKKEMPQTQVTIGP